MPWKFCTQYTSQFGKLSSGHRIGKVSFHSISKKGNAKEWSNYCTIALISQTSKVMLKILQDRLQQYVNRELPDVQAGFRKGREIQFSSVTQSCPTLCYPWAVAHQASLSITNSWSPLKTMSIESVMPSNHLTLCRPLLLLPSIFHRSGSFQMNQLITAGQSIGVSASASDLPMNTQDWSPLGWTGWVSLLS